MDRVLLLDLRKWTIAATKEGASLAEAAGRLSVGVSATIRWHALFRAGGEVAVSGWPGQAFWPSLGKVTKAGPRTGARNRTKAHVDAFQGSGSCHPGLVGRLP